MAQSLRKIIGWIHRYGTKVAEQIMAALRTDVTMLAKSLALENHRDVVQPGSRDRKCRLGECGVLVSACNGVPAPRIMQ